MRTIWKAGPLLEFGPDGSLNQTCDALPRSTRATTKKSPRRHKKHDYTPCYRVGETLRMPSAIGVDGIREAVQFLANADRGQEPVRFRARYVLQSRL
jgi:hypothetical protein